MDEYDEYFNLAQAQKPAKKETHLTSFRMDRQLFEQFQNLIEKHGYNKTKIYAMLIKEFIRMHDDTREH